ncbi:hypothetical protein KCU62_g318, partial [Aureobasidium sp. EXF-3399]
MTTKSFVLSTVATYSRSSLSWQRARLWPINGLSSVFSKLTVAEAIAKAETLDFEWLGKIVQVDKSVLSYLAVVTPSGCEALQRTSEEAAITRCVELRPSSQSRRNAAAVSSPLTCEFCFLVPQPSTLSAPASFFFVFDEPDVTVACSSLRSDDVSVRGKVICKAHDARGSNHRKTFHSSPQPHALHPTAQSTNAHVLSLRLKVRPLLRPLHRARQLTRLAGGSNRHSESSLICSSSLAVSKYLVQQHHQSLHKSLSDHASLRWSLQDLHLVEACVFCPGMRLCSIRSSTSTDLTNHTCALRWAVGMLCQPLRKGSSLFTPTHVQSDVDEQHSIQDTGDECRFRHPIRCTCAQPSWRLMCCSTLDSNLFLFKLLSELLFCYALRK